MLVVGRETSFYVVVVGAFQTFRPIVSLPESLLFPELHLRSSSEA